MSPKILKNHIFFVTIIFSVLLISACKDKSDGLISVENDPYSSTEFLIFDTTDGMEGIEDASLTKEMGFQSYFAKPDFPKNKIFGFHSPKRHLGKIFKDLKLSEQQRDSIHIFLQESKECSKEAFAGFKDFAKPIIEAANGKRKEIVEQLKNGIITKEEAHNLIKDLNANTRETLKSNTDFREALCECNLSLFDNINSILDETQQTAWTDWVESRDNNCTISN